MGTQYVIPTCPTFKNASIRSNQVVIADVVPFIGKNMERPDGSDPSGVIGHRAICRVVNDEVRYGSVIGGSTVVLAVRTSPISAGNNRRFTRLNASDRLLIFHGNGSDARIDKDEGHPIGGVVPFQKSHPLPEPGK